MVQVKFGKGTFRAQVLSYRHMDKIFIVRIHDMRLANGAFAYICCKKDQLIVKETASSKNAVKRKHENDDTELTKKHRRENGNQ